MRTLPDHLRKGMKLVIVGCNPSESSVRVGHYTPAREQFWPMLYAGGVVPEPFDYHDDKRVIDSALTHRSVKRPTKGIEELKREDFAEAASCFHRSSRNLPARRGVQWQAYLRTVLPAQVQIRHTERIALWRPSLRSAFHQRANAQGRSEKLRHFRKLAQ